MTKWRQSRATSDDRAAAALQVAKATNVVAESLVSLTLQLPRHLLEAEAKPPARAIIFECEDRVS
jgi:hypothetical protein